MNAFTSEDITFYINGLPANKLELWCWMESDRLQNSVFREFFSERDVVHEERRMRGRSSVGSGVQAFVMSTLCASASLSEACNGKGPFLIAPIHGMGISTSAVCSVSVFFSSKPCTARRRAQSVRQQRTQQPVSGPFVPSFETWHNEKWAESSQACPCT